MKEKWGLGSEPKRTRTRKTKHEGTTHSQSHSWLRFNENWKKTCDYSRMKQEIKTEMESHDEKTLTDVWVKAHILKGKGLGIFNE